MPASRQRRLKSMEKEQKNQYADWRTPQEAEAAASLGAVRCVLDDRVTKSAKARGAQYVMHYYDDKGRRVMDSYRCGDGRVERATYDYDEKGAISQTKLLRIDPTVFVDGVPVYYEETTTAQKTEFGMQVMQWGSVERHESDPEWYTTNREDITYDDQGRAVRLAFYEDDYPTRIVENHPDTQEVAVTDLDIDRQSRGTATKTFYDGEGKMVSQAFYPVSRDPDGLGGCFVDENKPFYPDNVEEWNKEHEIGQWLDGNIKNELLDLQDTGLPGWMDWYQQGQAQEQVQRPVHQARSQEPPSPDSQRAKADHLAALLGKTAGQRQEKVHEGGDSLQERIDQAKTKAGAEKTKTSTAHREDHSPGD